MRGNPIFTTNLSAPRTLAIRSRYGHHAEHSGYRQLLRYTEPVCELGIDERGSRPTPLLLKRYPWLYEVLARREVHRHAVDLVHVLYAEEYYRFLAYLLPATPIVLTFHQPADVLYREVLHGDPMGRIAAWTHRFSQSRFRRVAAAIITSESQREPLEKVMPPDRIHHIPLGASITELITISANLGTARNRAGILTVGNWRRDWRYYFEFVRECNAVKPEWRFTLVNRRLPPDLAALAAKLPNLTYTRAVSDEQLYQLYRFSSVQFLPFEAAAGNNSVNEGLAFGCPIVTNLPLGLEGSSRYSRVVPLVHADVIKAIASFVALPEDNSQDIATAAQAGAKARDWMHIAARTVDVYRSVL